MSLKGPGEPNSNQWQSDFGKVVIITARWNREVTESLRNACKETLLSRGVPECGIILVDAPGSYELPMAAQFAFNNQEVNAVVAIGTLIKGETMHFEYIAEAVSQGLMQVQLKHNKPVIFGVLTCLNDEQAKKRAGFLGGHNHGEDWAHAAVDMTLMKNSFTV